MIKINFTYLILLCFFEIYSSVFEYYYNKTSTLNREKTDNLYKSFIIYLKIILTSIFLEIGKQIFSLYLLYKSFSFVGTQGYTLFLCYVGLFFIIAIIEGILNRCYRKIFCIQKFSVK